MSPIIAASDGAVKIGLDVQDRDARIARRVRGVPAKSRFLMRAIRGAIAIGGAVAQLGERRVRNAKVEGSIPFRSTIFSGTCKASAPPIPDSFA